MVGDPAQLPATIFSREAQRANYGQSLFQRLQRGGHPKMMLDTQYRMHPSIASFASSRFYNGLLRYASGKFSCLGSAKENSLRLAFRAGESVTPHGHCRFMFSS